MAGRGEREPIHLLAEFTCDVGDKAANSSLTPGRGVADPIAGVLEIIIDLDALPQPAVPPLAPEERTLLQLCCFDGLTVAQVGERLGLAPATVAARLRHCLDRLKASLGPETGEERQSR